MILQFQKIIAAPKELIVPEGSFLCALIIAAGQCARDFACKACGERNDPLMMLLQQLMIDARLGIKALRPCFAHPGDQVLIAGIVFAQEHKMAALVVERIYFIMARACGNIDLAANHRLDAPLLRGTIKIDHSIHRAVVCNGHCRLPKCLSTVEQRPDSACAVKQAVFCMQMQMCKAGQESTSFDGGIHKFKIFLIHVDVSRRQTFFQCVKRPV